MIIKGGYNQGYHWKCFSSIQYRVTVRVTSTMLSNLLHIAHNVIYIKYVYQFKRNERVIDTFNAIVSVFLCSKKKKEIVWKSWQFEITHFLLKKVPSGPKLKEIPYTPPTHTHRPPPHTHTPSNTPLANRFLHHISSRVMVGKSLIKVAIRMLQLYMWCSNIHIRVCSMVVLFPTFQWLLF